MITDLRLTFKIGGSMAGMDEYSGLVGKSGGVWRALGAGKVHIIRRKTQTVYGAGKKVEFTNAFIEGIA